MGASTARDRATGLTMREAEVVAAWDGLMTQRELAEKLGANYAHINAILSRPHVRDAIRSRAQNEGLSDLVADRREREMFWTTVMRDDAEKTSDRMKAAEYLGKAQGDFIERHEHSGKDGGPLRFNVVTGITRAPNQPTEEDFDDL